MLVADGFCRKHLFFKLIKLLEIVVAYNHLDTMRKLPIKHLNELLVIFKYSPPSYNQWILVPDGAKKKETKIGPKIIKSETIKDEFSL